MSDTVWLLWFEQGGEDTELLIGVYRSEETAKGAIGFMRQTGLVLLVDSF